MGLRDDYLGRDIPLRLWRRGRPNRGVPTRDALYMRHERLAPGEGYGSCIPGHKSMEDQSVNSHAINRFGVPRDVLFDIEEGRHYWDHQIACFDVSDISQLDLPNDNSIQYRDRDKKIIKKPADRFTFRVLHEPEERMYPHCIIQAHRNGAPAKEVPKSMRTIIQRRFAKLAEQRRDFMTRFDTPSVRSRCGIKNVLMFWFFEILSWWRHGVTLLVFRHRRVR